MDPLKKQFGTFIFKQGGYFICRKHDSFAFIRCGNHKDRPSQADNLHLDVWVKGENILRDSGTYKYNTSKEISDYFMGTSAHNSVTVDHQSQMQKGSRFIWYYWSQKISGDWTDHKDYYIFSGSISVFRFLNSKAVHSREIKISKFKNEWIVKDILNNLDQYQMKQIWHLDNYNLNFVATNGNYNIRAQNEISYNSEYYGKKSKGEAISFAFKKEIETIISYNN